MLWNGRSGGRMRSAKDGVVGLVMYGGLGSHVGSAGMMMSRLKTSELDRQIGTIWLSSRPNSSRWYSCN